MSNLINIRISKGLKNILLLKFLICVFFAVLADDVYSKSFRSSPSHRVTKPRSSKFLTGVVAGSLLFPRSSNSVSYSDSYDMNYEDELYIEYERNNELLLKGDLSDEKKLKLERRNQQIKNKLIKASNDKYVSSYSLKLIPVKQKTIEKYTNEAKGLMKFNNFLGRNSSNGRKQAQSERRQIWYQLNLSSDSPKPIEDFDVLSINGIKTLKDNPYFFKYTEQWGENLIKVRLRDKKEHSLILDLNTSYYIKKIENNNFFDNIFELYFLTCCLMIPFALFKIVRGDI